MSQTQVRAPVVRAAQRVCTEGERGVGSGEERDTVALGSKASAAVGEGPQDRLWEALRGWEAPLQSGSWPVLDDTRTTGGRSAEPGTRPHCG